MAEHARLLLAKNRAYLELYVCEIQIARLRNRRRPVPAAMLRRQEELAAEYDRLKSAVLFRSSRWAYTSPDFGAETDDDRGTWAECEPVPDLDEDDSAEGMQ